MINESVHDGEFVFRGSLIVRQPCGRTREGDNYHSRSNYLRLFDEGFRGDSLIETGQN